MQVGSLVSGEQKLNSVSTVQSDYLSNPASKNYSYQGWLYFNSAPASTADQVIFGRGDDFGVVIKGNTLKVVAKSGDNTFTAVVTNAFPIQKWTHFAFSVNSAHVVDIYLNGKLVKTVKNTISNGFATNVNTALTIGSAGLNGVITRFVRKPNTLTPDDVAKFYLGGNGSNIFSTIWPYNLSMSISKDDVLQKQYTMF